MKKHYKIYASSTSKTVVAQFESKKELLEYGEKNGTNADCVVLFDNRNPDGFAFLGWDEIESNWEDCISL